MSELKINAAFCLYCGKRQIIPGDEKRQEVIEKMRQHDLSCEKSPFNQPMSCGHPQRYAVNAFGLEDVCVICLSIQQADEWDRFWEAMGVKSADITVDQAIEKYRALEAELADSKRERASYSDRMTSRLGELETEATQSILANIEVGKLNAELQDRVMVLEAANAGLSNAVNASAVRIGDLVTALEPVANVWREWMVERKRKGSPFENVNKFAVYLLCGSQENHFKNTAKILDGKP